LHLLEQPGCDARFGVELVKSRAGLEKEADIVVTDSNFAEVLDPKNFQGISCLLVDEVQFMSEQVVAMFRTIADEADCPVICYGLRTDFKLGLFPGSRMMMELADCIEEVKTTCYQCNKKAIFNLKLVDGKGTLGGPSVDINIGLEEKYVPTCSKHFHKETAHCRESNKSAQSFSIADADSKISTTIPSKQTQTASLASSSQSSVSTSVPSKSAITVLSNKLQELNVSKIMNKENITPNNSKSIGPE
jgi:thymidine kinase